MPEMVPQEPIPATSTSTFPPVSCQISGPVVRLWASGFLGFANWEGRKAPGISRARRSATPW